MLNFNLQFQGPGPVQGVSIRTLSGPPVDFSPAIRFSQQNPLALVFWNYNDGSVRSGQHAPPAVTGTTLFLGGRTVVQALRGLKFPILPGQLEGPTSALNMEVIDFAQYLGRPSTACASKQEAQKNYKMLQQNMGTASVVHFAKYALQGLTPLALLGQAGAYHGSIIVDFPALEYSPNSPGIWRDQVVSDNVFPKEAKGTTAPRRAPQKKSLVYHLPTYSCHFVSPYGAWKVLRMELARGGGNIYSNMVPGRDPVHGHMVSYARLGFAVVVGPFCSYDLLSSNCIHFASFFAARAVMPSSLNMQILPEDADRETIKQANGLAMLGNHLRSGAACLGLMAPGHQEGAMPFDDLSNKQKDQLAIVILGKVVNR
eukprot:g15924.t1